MTDTLTARLIDERGKLVARFEGIKETIGEETRDANPTELATMQNVRDRIAEVDRQLDITTTDIQVRQETADRIARLMPGAVVAPRDFAYSRGGEAQALWDCLHRSSDDDARARWTRATEQTRAAQHMGTTVVGTTAIAGGFDGLIVNPVLGPVISLYPTETPFLNLIGPRNAPTGKFMRPRLIDPDLLTAAGPHAGGLEKGEIPSKKWNYDTDPVSMTTIGNYINLSYEAMEWVPTALNDVISHLRLRTALGLESRVVAEAAKTGAHIELDSAADAEATNQAVWDAMARVFIATGQPATWLASGPLGLAMLGGKVDSTGRSLFPVVGASNAPGTASGFAVINPWGLRYAQTSAITDTAIYVGNGSGLECYLRWLPTLQADEPSVVGRQIGVAASVGFFSPITNETGPERNAIVKIADTIAA